MMKALRKSPPKTKSLPNLTQQLKKKKTIQNRFDKLKAEAISSIDTKASALNSNKYPSYYDPNSSDIIKWILLKSPDVHSHAS